MKNIHIIAPASSAKIEYRENFISGEKKLLEKGFAVSYGKNIFDMSFMEKSGSIENRIDDWNSAWSTGNSDYILAFTGGTNSNQILDYIDWSIVRDSKKTFIGYSDITLLANAIYAKTGKVSFLGVNFSYLCRESAIEYTLENFANALNNKSYTVTPSNIAIMNIWEQPINPVPSEGWWTINDGSMAGKVLGGNLPSLRLLYGTEYMPDISDTILFIEWDNFTTADAEEFDRELEALSMQENFESVRGLVIGRFQEGSNISREILEKIIKNKKKLNNIPIVANVDFGHTAPMFIFPVGGNATIEEDHKAIHFSY